MSFFSVEVGKFMYFMYASKIEGEILLRCHSERCEESVVPRNIGCLQILHPTKNVGFRMTKEYNLTK